MVGWVISISLGLIVVQIIALLTTWSLAHSDSLVEFCVRAQRSRGRMGWPGQRLASVLQRPTDLLWRLRGDIGSVVALDTQQGAAGIEGSI